MILIFLQLDMNFKLQTRKAELSRRVTVYAKQESKLPEKVAKVLCLKFLLRYDGGYVS